MNIMTTFAVYMANEKDGDDGAYTVQRAPVTYKDLESASNGIHEYAKFYPNTVFLLIDEDAMILALGIRWDGQNYHYAEDAVGMDVSYMFHTHSEG